MLTYPIRNQDEAQLRLSGCIIQHKGYVCKVVDIERDCVVLTNIFGVFKVLFKDLDTRPFPLGYVKTEKGLPYLVRKPARQAKLGWHRSISLTGEDPARLPLEALQDAYDGKYPSFEEAVQIAAKTRIAQPFSNDWCVSSDGCLVYRGSAVGLACEDGAILNKDKCYLLELLEGVLNK